MGPTATAADVMSLGDRGPSLLGYCLSRITTWNLDTNLSSKETRHELN
jgi:hypothetical protein